MNDGLKRLAPAGCGDRYRSGFRQEWLAPHLRVDFAIFGGGIVGLILTRMLMLVH